MTAIINNWCVSPQNPYAAPELQRACISGVVTGSDRFDDGATITTSSIKSVNQDADGVVSVITYSDSLYVLGTVDPNYEQLYPGAKERLLKSSGQ